MDKEDQFRHLKHRLSSKIKVDHQQFLYFGGTAYLSMPQHKKFISLFIEGIDKYGLNNGTSRGNNIQLGIYEEVEQYAASKYDVEAALITSSGYLAAKLTIAALTNEGKIRYAPDTHPALWGPEKPVVLESSFDDWAVNTVKEINESSYNKWVLISNSMNNLFPESYDFSFIDQIEKDKKIILIIDDSHGIGILNEGKSVLPGIPKLPQVEIVVVASMAKALGVDAGIVLGSKCIIEKLKQGNEFNGASPSSAAGLYAFMHAEHIYKEEYNRLQKNMVFFANKIDLGEDWRYEPGFPVFLYRNEGLAAKLLPHHILISSFPYPDKKGKIIDRIVLSSWHSKADLSHLITALN
jgi:8-amino-7-oxononanoate synthase